MLCRPLQWFARGGSHLNFYNWAGGNQFARNEGGSISNAYYWKAELASDNLPQGPERAHIAKAFAALKMAAPTLLAVDAQVCQPACLSATCDWTVCM